MNDKIIITDNNQCIFLKIDSIYYIQAAGAYSNIHLQNGQKLVVSKNLKTLCEKLPENIFCRIHKSYLININYIQKYIKSEKRALIMANGDALPVSAKRKSYLMQYIEHLSL